MGARNYSSVAVDTTLTGGITAAATSLTVASASGFPTAPFTIIVDADTASEEVMEVTNVASTTFTVTRGVDGTSGVTHDIGATVQHGVSARDFQEPNDHIQATTSVHGITNTANLATTADLASYATLASPTFTGTVTLPSTTSIGSVDSTELGYVNGVTSAIQTQLDGKAAAPTWGAYTPTWTNVTVGNGTLDFQYAQIGKIVFVHGTLTFGSTTSVSGEPQFTLPVTAVSYDAKAPVQGNCTLVDTGTETYFGSMLFNSTTKVAIRKFGLTGSSLVTSAISSTAPFTWTTGDIIAVGFWFEAA